jgi:Predicted transcriptional regulators
MERKKEEKKVSIATCPIRNILNRFGDKWSILVLDMLHTNGTMRFRDLDREIEDISQRMLTVTLRSLEADGLIHRKTYPEVPPRVEYSLSDRGNGLMPHIQSLVTWSLENMSDILKEREKAG